MRRLARVLGTLAMVAVALWGAGFVWFNQIARQPGVPLAAADGIVVLTGGAERIETALRLLSEGAAPLLLVSGVAKSVDVDDLIRRAPGAKPTPDRVTVGHDATTTLGNATEVASWAHEHGMRSLVVVTAGYHMPRALLEIGRVLPGVALHPAPVLSPAFRNGVELAMVRVVALEYNKWLAVRLGLARWLREDPT